jgi:AraC family transcriptional regulator, regulatory protein of adaptative response / methylated-DNA-[protein]-cysteine methyltransferase
MADQEQFATASLADPRWAAVLARDAAADGRFVYAVLSTGIYCRPVCPSRRPRPENVAFYSTPAVAEAAGFRPCKRCQPTQDRLAVRQMAMIADFCRFIETAEEAPTLAELARRSGLSPHHLHRLFKAGTGLTPHAYAQAVRAERLRRNLPSSATLTEAVFAAGYNSSSHFYAAAGQLLGMAPAAYRAGGRDAEIRFAIGQCSLGAILVAQSARGVCAIALGGDPQQLAQDLQARFPAARLIGDDVEFAAVVARVVGMVEAPGLGLDLPLDIRGTAFQQRVWQALQRIPPGTTLSYSALAAAIGAPQAVRAVAGACAANVLAVAIPCHRVVRSDGGLSGYRWGVERKRALLAREADDAAQEGSGT